MCAEGLSLAKGIAMVCSVFLSAVLWPTCGNICADTNLFPPVAAVPLGERWCKNLDFLVLQKEGGSMACGPH